MTTREKFVEHFMVLFQKELLEKLPKRAKTITMLHKAENIIDRLIEHITNGINEAQKEQK